MRGSPADIRCEAQYILPVQLGRIRRGEILGNKDYLLVYPGQNGRGSVDVNMLRVKMGDDQGIQILDRKWIYDEGCYCTRSSILGARSTVQCNVISGFTRHKENLA